MDAIRREGTATVPTAKSLELPNMAYTIGGTKLESETHILGINTCIDKHKQYVF